jgi:hypothetical protein
VPPSCAIAAAERSPSVTMCTSSTGAPVAAVIASATACDWVRASALARVPSRSVAVAVDVAVRVTTPPPQELRVDGHRLGQQVLAPASSMPRPNSARSASA